MGFPMVVVYFLVFMVNLRVLLAIAVSLKIVKVI